MRKIIFNHNKVAIIMYHYVRDLQGSRYPEIKGLDLKLFKHQIEFLCANFNIITMEQLLAAVYENIKLPENAVLLTFDDGYIDHFTNVFPILNNKKIQGSFFIPAKTVVDNKLLDVNKIHFILASATPKNIVSELYRLLDYYRGKDFVIESNEELYNRITHNEKSRFDTEEVIFIKVLLQRSLEKRLRNLIVDDLFDKIVGIDESIFAKELYVSYEQIKNMKNNGMHIGIHGYDHYWLGHLEKEKMQVDIKNALEFWEGIVNKDSWVMNYPYGSYNNDVITFIKSVGCKLSLTTNVNIADIKQDDPWKMPRLDTNDFPPKSNEYIKFIK